eukprot:10719373-Lingulodinium_polyedra.AAC.1
MQVCGRPRPFFRKTLVATAPARTPLALPQRVPAAEAASDNEGRNSGSTAKAVPTGEEGATPLCSDGG